MAIETFEVAPARYERMMWTGDNFEELTTWLVGAVEADTLVHQPANGTIFFLIANSSQYLYEGHIWAGQYVYVRVFVDGSRRLVTQTPTELVPVTE